MQTNSGLPRFSYSKLSTFIQCPMKYKLRYIDGNYSEESKIELELGNILHKVLEIKYRAIIDGDDISQEKLIEIMFNGIEENTQKDKGKRIQGINELKIRYGFDRFSQVSEKSGLSYNQKIDNFTIRLSEELNDKWKPIAVELPFTVNFENRVLFTGFIDRVDQNKHGDIRVVDYKTSDKLFEKKELATPLQMVIYALACKNIFGKIPIEYIYEMILLNEIQYACTNGFLERGIAKIQKTLDEIEWCHVTNTWKPKQSPLCWWCEFSGHNENNPWYTAGLCEYYLLWTPENRTFEKNKDFN